MVSMMHPGWASFARPTAFYDPFSPFATDELDELDDEYMMGTAWPRQAHRMPAEQQKRPQSALPSLTSRHAYQPYRQYRPHFPYEEYTSEEEQYEPVWRSTPRRPLATSDIRDSPFQSPGFQRRRAQQQQQQQQQQQAQQPKQNYDEPRRQIHIDDDEGSMERPIQSGRPYSTSQAKSTRQTSQGPRFSHNQHKPKTDARNENANNTQQKQQQTQDAAPKIQYINRDGLLTIEDITEEEIKPYPHMIKGMKRLLEEIEPIEK